MTEPAAAEDAPLYVLDIHASRFMLIDVWDAKVDAKAGVTILCGKNANAKTGAMTAIAATLRGGEAVPEMPVKAGAERAETWVGIGSADGTPLYKARRVYLDGSDKSTLTVTAADGSKVASPQSFLNQLTDAAMFNPVRFADPKMGTAKSDNAARLEMLFGLCPLRIDLAAHDARAADLKRDRSAADKRARELEAVVRDAAAAHADVPAGAKEDESSLVTEIAQIENAGQVRATAAKRCEELKKEIADVEAEIVKLRARADLLAAECVKQGNVALGKSAGDVAALKAKLSDVRARNAKRESAASDLARADERAKQLLAERTKSADLDAELERMAKERADAITAAKFPIPQMTIDSDGRLALRNKEGAIIPFSQASSAQRIKVGFAVMMSKNPRLRACLVPSGNDLDPDSMSQLAKLAARFGVRVFVERWMPDASGTSIEFREGKVVSETPAGGAS